MIPYKSVEIAKALKIELARQDIWKSNISFFLCGGASKDGSHFRESIKKLILSKKYKYDYSVHYPEEMFFDLILGHQNHDLLSLENMLADNVHCVIILLDSPGTFAELGAFSNHLKLKKKLVLVVNEKYKRAKSFINLGPLRSIKKSGSKIIYDSLNKEFWPALVDKILESAKEIWETQTVQRNFSNPIWSYWYFLSLIYIFDPIKRNKLEEILERIVDTEEERAWIQITLSASLSVLIKEQKIRTNFSELTTNKLSELDVFQLFRTKERRKKILDLFSELRIEALDSTLRRKGWKKWEAATA